MNIFSIDLTPGEIQCLRQSLDVISISGKDAKFVANLQVKLEQEFAQIQEILKQEETKKQQELQETLAREDKKAKK
jgi:hypothetical protein